jgi:hypothetical protein
MVIAVLVPAGGAIADPGDGPQIVFADPSEGAVYYQGQIVRAGYGCLPGPTGVPAVTCTGDVPSGALLDTTVFGDHLFTVRAVDPWGMTTTAVVHYTVVDVVSPVINVTAPADHATYEFGSLVTVSYGCDDPGGAGVIFCFGSLPNGYPLRMNHLGTSTFDVQAFDAAGNSSTTHVTYQVVDDIAPTIVMASPAAAVGDRLPVYTLGELVVADYSCSDNGGTGIASCWAPAFPGAPIDTRTVGLHDFTVLANDAAHNRASLSHPYRVVYVFDGFATPLTAWPAFAPVDGGDIPVKFSLGTDFGPNVIAGAVSRRVACDTAAPAGSFEAATGSTSYSAGPNRYTFRWSTDGAWAGTCRELQLTLNDGTVHRAGVRFKG